MKTRLLFIVAAASLAGGCATTPASLQGDAVDITPAQARDVGRAGVPVRWGGRIVSVRAQSERTCIELIGSQLSVYGRSKHMYDDGSGRFVACSPGYLDPAVYLKNRELTVVGRLDGFEAPSSGSRGYARPRVAADNVHLWPEAPNHDPRYPYSKHPWPWAGWGWGDSRY